MLGINVFKKASFTGSSKLVIVWHRIKYMSKDTKDEIYQEKVSTDKPWHYPHSNLLPLLHSNGIFYDNMFLMNWIIGCLFRKLHKPHKPLQYNPLFPLLWKLIDWLYGVSRHYRRCINHIPSASAPFHASLEIIQPILCTIFFPNHWLLSHITIFKQWTAVREEWNPVAMTIISPWKGNWLSQRFEPATSFSQVFYAPDWTMGAWL